MAVAVVDNTAGEADQRRTAVQKSIALERMLEFIAQFAPPLLYREIIRQSTSLDWIWSRIRRHYHLVQSEVNFLSLHQLTRKEDERYETFYQRILAHLHDNLLTVASGLQHDGAAITADENISPTTERLAVYLWLARIDERLPSHVQRVYAHELSMKTLKDLQPQLSRSMDALLSDIATQQDIQVHYTRSSFSGTNNNNQRRQFRPNQQRSNTASRSQRPSSSSSNKICSLCKAVGGPRPHHHRMLAIIQI